MRLVLLLLLAGCSTLVLAGASAREAVREPDAFGLTDAAGFTEFPLFSAGDKVDGLPLVAVLRREDTADFVSFVYGDCVAADDAGCPPPVEVQVWPACRRNLGLYDPGATGAPVPERVTVRGVPAAVLEDGLRLELQSARSTIVVFGDSRQRVARVVAALRRVGERLTGDPLPPPAPGAVEGTLTC
jgi:hypothetical protein